MEEIQKMEKKTDLIYRCPYCCQEIWFDKANDLAYHIYNEHIKALLKEKTAAQKTRIKKTYKKWMLQK